MWAAKATADKKFAASLFLGSSPRTIVARGDAPEVLQPAEGILDKMAVAIAPFVLPNPALAAAPTWNDRLCAVLGQGLAQGVSIVALVRDQASGTANAGQQIASGPDVADIAGGEPDHSGTAQSVCYHVNSCSLSAAHLAGSWEDAARSPGGGGGCEARGRGGAFDTRRQPHATR